ncbi:MAG: SAM-dependent methyltransferase [Arcticibacterium sp.]|jgi:SAM-dependent methyltransferase
MSELNDAFWSNRYTSLTTGWDLGEISSPLKAYLDQIEDRDMSILIPGCGNAYEAAYILSLGFKKVTLIDISAVLVEALKIKFQKEIASGQCELIHADFFELKGSFDLVLEQTFFCAITPILRSSYVKKMSEIIAPKGKIAGLLFEMDKPQGPPFGGNRDEYTSLFEMSFTIKTMENCFNSISSRSGKELFVIFELK